MATSIEATVVLCDAAQASEGKLNVLGGGWTRVVANAPVPMALGIIMHVPFDMTNRPIRFRAALLDDDGQPVEVEGQSIGGAGELEVGRPPGIKQGERLNFPLVLSFHGLMLPSGGYVWECYVGDDVVARCPFRVMEGGGQ